MAERRLARASSTVRRSLHLYLKDFCAALALPAPARAVAGLSTGHLRARTLTSPCCAVGACALASSERWVSESCSATSRESAAGVDRSIVLVRLNRSVDTRKTRCSCALFEVGICCVVTACANWQGALSDSCCGCACALYEVEN